MEYLKTTKSYGTFVERLRWVNQKYIKYVLVSVFPYPTSVPVSGSWEGNCALLLENPQIF